MKKVLIFIFNILDKRVVVEALLELLDKQANKTANKVDDEIVAYLKTHKEILIESLENVDKKIS